MDESQSRFYKKWQIPMAPQGTEEDFAAGLKSGRAILDSISARAPLAKTLNDICGALDCQLGNTVSLISITGRNAESLAEAAQPEAILGLQIFSSKKVLNERGEELGLMETYSCVPRTATDGELQLVQEAHRLAALAIGREMSGTGRANSRALDNQPVQRRVLAWPDFMS
jgi:hypothetical protein